MDQRVDVLQRVRFVGAPSRIPTQLARAARLPAHEPVHVVSALAPELTEGAADEPAGAGEEQGAGCLLHETEDIICCGQRRETMRHLEIEGGHLLRLDVGEKLPAGLIAFCRELKLPAATATGIGALRDVELGYYNVETRAYERTRLEGSWEMLSLFADVAAWEEDLFAHTHVVLGGPDFIARGGHLFEGTVSVTAELRVTPIAREIARKMNDDFRLHFLDF
jgi:hypothetical protein